MNAAAIDAYPSADALLKKPVRRRRQRDNASRYHGKAPDEIVWAEPERQTRAVREYLAGLEAENEPNPDRKPPKVISPSDPCSAWTAKANKRVQFGYGLNYLVDTENAAIVDVEPTPARTDDEVESTKTRLDRTERRLNLKPKRLALIEPRRGLTEPFGTTGASGCGS